MARKPDYQPMPQFIDKFPDVSGNDINGLGETAERRPSTFFWHPPERQTHGALQKEVTDYHRQSDAVREWFKPNPPGGRGPDAVPRSETRIEKPAGEWSAIVKQFTLENESDLVGIAEIDPLWIYDGYEISEPWVIMIGVTMDYAELAEAPSSFENPRAAVVVAKARREPAASSEISYCPRATTPGPTRGHTRLRSIFFRQRSPRDSANSANMVR
jgi:hypothetical protein